MIEALQTLNFVLALLVLLLAVDGVVLIVDQYRSRILAPIVKLWGIAIAFFVTFSGTVLTLIYSEVFGIVPCGLCWFQRIFLYPQVFILGVALWTKEKVAAARYGIALSVPGLVIALYHYYIQMGGSELINCPAAAGDCGKRYIFEFGFVTFPLIAAIVFAFLITLYLYILKTEKEATRFQVADDQGPSE